MTKHRSPSTGAACRALPAALKNAIRERDQAQEERAAAIRERDILRRFNHATLRDLSRIIAERDHARQDLAGARETWGAALEAESNALRIARAELRRLTAAGPATPTSGCPHCAVAPSAIEAARALADHYRTIAVETTALNRSLLLALTAARGQPTVASFPGSNTAG